MRGRKVKSRDCALASDLVRAAHIMVHLFHIACCSNLSPSRAATRGGFAAARAACVSTWLGESARERKRGP